jgi:hypothetical protein
VTYDPDIGELTGLMHLSRLPWDTAGAWWIDVLVTFESQTGRRTDGYEMGIVMSPKSSSLDVRQRVRELLDRICAVDAVITHIRRPMEIEMIRWIQIFNAVLVRDRAKDRAEIFGSEINE